MERGAGTAQRLDHPARSLPGMRTLVIYYSINTSTDFQKKKKIVLEVSRASHMRKYLETKDSNLSLNFGLVHFRIVLVGFTVFSDVVDGIN